MLKNNIMTTINIHQARKSLGLYDILRVIELARQHCGGLGFVDSL